MRNHQKPTNRLPLEQISSLQIKNKQYTQQSTQHDAKQINKYTALNQNESVRLNELRNKYTIGSAQNKNLLSSSTNKQNSFVIDSSFNQIKIFQVNRNEFSKNRKISQNDSNNNEKQNNYGCFAINLNENKKINQSFSNKATNEYLLDFNNKVEKTDKKIQMNLQKLQQKVKRLKKMNNERSKIQYSQRSSCENKSKVISQQPSQFKLKNKENYSQLDNYHNLTNQSSEINKQKFIVDIKIQEKQYARQLKSKNFIQQMKKKIQQIQKQKKSNLNKKLSHVLSQTSKTQQFSHQHFEHFEVQEEFNQKETQPHKQKKITLANFTPNLAESQIIQSTQHGKRISRQNDYQNISSYKTFEQKHYPTTRQNHNTIESQNYSRNQSQQLQIAHEQENRKQSTVQSHLFKSPQFKSTYLEQAPSQPQICNQQSRIVQSNKLQGELNIGQKQIQRQFALLINRIAWQAEIDNKFACKIHGYDMVYTSKKSLKLSMVQSLVKNYRQRHQSFDQSILQISQMQLDPLSSSQKTYQELSSEVVLKMALQTKKQYQKLTNYYNNKLYKQFSYKTIHFFIDQLEKCHSLKSNDELNTGHLTSYINMRTGKNLRNRFLYKFIRRLSETVGQKSSLYSSTLKRDDICTALIKN